MGKTKRSKSSLPLDVMVNVLSRLPVKSICRFRCVSKEWLALLSSSGPGSVKDLHDKQPHKVPALVMWDLFRFDNDYTLGIHAIVDSNRRKRIMEKMTYDLISVLPYINDYTSGELLKNLKLHSNGSSVDKASCHGLVCFIGLAGNELHVCNPSTREMVKLPDSPNSSLGGNVFRVGFGYLSHTNQYKIVRWLRRDRARKMGCEIFTLTDGGKSPGSWRATANNKQPYLKLERKNVCVKGVIYWLCEKKNNYSVLAFDLGREEAKIIQCLEVHADPGYNCLIEFKGELCLAKGGRWEVNAWILKDHDDNPKWVPEYDLRFIPYSLDMVLYIHGNDEDLELLLSFFSRNTIMCYDGKSGTITICRRERKSSKLERGEYPCVYFDTLFSLQGKE